MEKLHVMETYFSKIARYLFSCEYSKHFRATLAHCVITNQFHSSTVERRKCIKTQYSESLLVLCKKY